MCCTPTLADGLTATVESDCHTVAAMVLMPSRTLMLRPSLLPMSRPTTVTLADPVAGPLDLMNVLDA
jgi:hypothetical protein